MTGLFLWRGRGVQLFFDTQLLEIVESRLLLWGEMAKVTFQPGLGIGRLWGRGPDGYPLVLGSVHIIVDSVAR